VRQIVVVVWESLDYICAQRLVPQLLSTARHLARFGELDTVGVTLTPHPSQQLAQSVPSHSAAHDEQDTLT
jgi:hypothetical protein